MGLQQRLFAWRMATFFGALFLVYGVSLPYLPVYLDARGLSSTEIGIAASLPLFLRLILTPAIAMLADRRGDHRGMIIALGSVAAAAIALVVIARGFWPILICIAAFQIAIQSIMPLADTIAMAGVRRDALDYGRMRLWGSATFVLITFVGAWVLSWGGADAVVGLLGLTTLITVAAAFALPRSGGQSTARVGRPAGLSAAAALLRSRPVLLFLIAATGAQSAHAVFYAFGVLHWQTVGVPTAWIGILWSVGVIAEIALFWWSAQVLQRLRSVDLIAIGAGAALIRWSLMAFDPPLALLLPLQLLHGLTFGASHLGAMHFMKEQVTESHAGTAQALYSTVTAGIGMGLAFMVAGPAYDRFAGLSYLAMSVLATVALGAAIALRRSATAVRVPAQVSSDDR